MNNIKLIELILNYRIYNFNHFSFFPVYKESKDFPFTAMILNLTPGISPTACPIQIIKKINKQLIK